MLIDAFTLLIREKNNENYALSQCKTFSLKIGLCKMLTKYHVWGSYGTFFSCHLFLDALASLKTMLDIKWVINGFKITVVQSITEYYRALQSIAEYCRVLQSIAECYRVLQSVTEYYRVLQSVTMCYRVLQSVTEC